MDIVLHNNWIPYYLVNTAELTLMLGAFEGSNVIAHGSGLLTVTIMGIWLAKMKRVEVDDILELKNLKRIINVWFVYPFVSRIEVSALLNLGWRAIIVLLVMMFIARPISVFISSLGTNLNRREIAFLSWIAPKGLLLPQFLHYARRN